MNGNIMKNLSSINKIDRRIFTDIERHCTCDSNRIYVILSENFQFLSLAIKFGITLPEWLNITNMLKLYIY